MDSYKITVSYGNDNLNDIFIKVLIKELNNMICKNKEFDVISNCTYFTSLEEGGKN